MELRQEPSCYLNYPLNCKLYDTILIWKDRNMLGSPFGTPIQYAIQWHPIILAFQLLHLATWSFLRQYIQIQSSHMKNQQTSQKPHCCILSYSLQHEINNPTLSPIIFNALMIDDDKLVVTIIKPQSFNKYLTMTCKYMDCTP